MTMASEPAAEEQEIGTHDEGAFSFEVRRRKKQEAILTSHLGKHKEKDRTIDTFWNTLWPALEKQGWTKIEKTGLHAGGIYFVPEGVTLEVGRRGEDYYERMIDVINRVLERRTPEEASVADAYISRMSFYAERDLQDKAMRQADYISAQPKKRKAVPNVMDLSWKDGGREYPKRSSNVGPEYQVTELPKAGSYDKDKDGSDQYCELIWDPDEARVKFVPVDQNDHILGGRPHNKKQGAILMVAQRGYNMDGFDEALEEMEPANGANWSPEKKAKFHSEIFRMRKDMNALSKSMDIDMKTCLGYYLGSFKNSDDYRLLKVVCQEEREDKAHSDDYGVDSCVICGDGGELMICDGCEKEFHMECLQPPLKIVPEGHWQCDECVNKNFLAARDYLILNTGIFEQETRKKTLDEMGDGGPDERIVLRPTEPVLEAVRKFADSVSRALSKDQSTAA